MSKITGLDDLQHYHPNDNPGMHPEMHGENGPPAMKMVEPAEVRPLRGEVEYESKGQPDIFGDKGFARDVDTGETYYAGRVGPESGRSKAEVAADPGLQQFVSKHGSLSQQAEISREAAKMPASTAEFMKKTAGTKLAGYIPPAVEHKSALDVETGQQYAVPDYNQ